MNDRKLPALPSAVRTPPVWLVAGLVVALVAGVLWFSFGGGTDPGGSSRGALELGSQPSDDPGDAESGEGEETDEPSAEPSSTTSPAALERSVRRFRAAQRRLAERVNAQLKRRTSPFSFRIASFNVLGDSHTGPGGNKKGFPDGSARMNMAIGAIRNSGVDVVGFQEMEASQYNMFNARAGEYSLYPGLSWGDKSVRFNIAWRTSMWTFVEGHALSIPYAGGSHIDMPVVLLESVSTGRRAWFANFHNPADTPNLGNNGRWRAAGAAIEVAHLTSLYQEQGYPVFATGDYNERSEIFCRFTAGGVFSAAAGGSNSGGCLPPDRMEVDWIFGSTGTSFEGYAITGVGKASDHNMVNATATLLAAG